MKYIGAIKMKTQINLDIFETKFKGKITGFTTMPDTKDTLVSVLVPSYTSQVNKNSGLNIIKYQPVSINLRINDIKLLSKIRKAFAEERRLLK